MSTIVGTCTDCIVSLPAQPTTSLKFRVVVEKGQGAIIRQLGTFNAYYPSENISSQQLVTLAASGSFTPALPDPLTALCVSVNGPVTVTLTKGGTVTPLTVNKILIVDDAYTAISIANPSTTAAVQVQLNYSM